MTNFTICTNHTVDQLTIKDEKGDPACVFCELERLRGEEKEVDSDLFVCVWEDRHLDDNISVHCSEEGALNRLEEHMDSAEYQSVQWVDEDPTPGEWIKAVRGEHDDDPSGHVFKLELEE